MRTLLLVGLSVAIAAPALAADPSVVYLVRHAEKATDSKDPNLTADGTLRAAALANVLEDLPITDVYSTDYNRTKATATPTATGHKLQVQIYDPSKPEAMLDEVRKPGVHLVVGHSNTAPALVEALGGDKSEEIDEMEYDRLSVVFLDENGEATSQLLRYGTLAH